MAGDTVGRGQRSVPRGRYLLFGQLQLLLQQLVALRQAPVLLQQGLPDARRQLQVPLFLRGGGALCQPGPVPNLSPILQPPRPTRTAPSSPCTEQAAAYLVQEVGDGIDVVVGFGDPDGPLGAQDWGRRAKGESHWGGGLSTAPLLPPPRAAAPPAPRVVPCCDGDRRWSCSTLVTKMDFSAAWCGQRCSRWHRGERGQDGERPTAEMGWEVVPAATGGIVQGWEAAPRPLHPQPPPQPSPPAASPFSMGLLTEAEPSTGICSSPCFGGREAGDRPQPPHFHRTVGTQHQYLSSGDVVHAPTPLPTICNGAKAAPGCGPRNGHSRITTLEAHLPPTVSGALAQTGSVGPGPSVCPPSPSPNPTACRRCQTAPGTHPDGSAGATQQEGASSEHEAPSPAHTPNPFCTPQPLPTPPSCIHSPVGACLSFPQQSGARPMSVPFPPSPSSAPPAGGGCLGQAKWVNGRGSATQIPLRRPSWGCVMVRASSWQCPHSPPVSLSSPPQAQPWGEGGQPQPQPPPRAPIGPGPCRGPQLHLVRPLSC